MVILNLHTSLKEKQVDHQILKGHLLLEKITRTRTKKTQNQHQNQTPTMTPKRMRIEPEHTGEKQKRGYLVDQLFKHGWRWPKTPNGKVQNLHKET